MYYFINLPYLLYDYGFKLLYVVEYKQNILNDSNKNKDIYYHKYYEIKK
jgi:hypothetical protein